MLRPRYAFVPRVSRLFFRPVSSSNKTGGSLGVPFADDLTNSNSDLLDNFPNLEGFLHIDEKIPTQRPTTGLGHTGAPKDEYDFSDIPILPNNNDQEIPIIDFGKAYSAQDIITQKAIKNIPRNYSADELQELTHLTEFNSLLETPKKAHVNLEEFLSFVHRLHTNDTRPSMSHALDLETISKYSKSSVFISKFNNPHLNLALEYYIYDNMPATDGVSRLVLYKNKPCIVIGKNQNPLKEINMHYSNITSTPILRRLSGGGTVVHDMGNFNFSFMSKKNQFDRTNFTDLVTNDLNLLVDNEPIEIEGKQIQLPKHPLSTIAKGDIINSWNNKKISGSAFKLSRGKFIHHGTMLLQSQLSNLSKLLKLTPERKANIIAQGTDSIPSPVQNYEINEDLFLYSMISTYTNNFESSLSEGVHIIDRYDQLPSEVLQRAEELTYWSWVFGKTPFFKHELIHDDFKLSFEIEKFCIKSVNLETEDLFIEKCFARLIESVNQGQKIKYMGHEVGTFIDDTDLAEWLSWELDFNAHYENLGVQLDK